MPMSELGGLILLDVNFFLNFILPVFLPCVRHAWKKWLSESVISKGWSPTGILMVLAVVKYEYLLYAILPWKLSVLSFELKFESNVFNYYLSQNVQLSNWDSRYLPFNFFSKLFVLPGKFFTIKKQFLAILSHVFHEALSGLWYNR